MTGFIDEHRGRFGVELICAVLEASPSTYYARNRRAGDARGRAPRLRDLTLTNGSLLAGKARVLRDAGLSRVTVSLDSLDNEVFTAMNDVDFPVERVLAGIEAAAAAGLGPIKINMVVRRGLNEDSVLPMARYFRGTGMILRFIEYMDVGHTNGWRLDDVVPAAEIIETIDAQMPLESVDPNDPGAVATRWRDRDGAARSV